ncbi:hypothetical protein L210DRAFT_3632253, partial [Boletus edulis BED1]
MNIGLNSSVDSVIRYSTRSHGHVRVTLSFHLFMHSSLFLRTAISMSGGVSCHESWERIGVRREQAERVLADEGV